MFRRRTAIVATIVMFSSAGAGLAGATVARTAAASVRGPVIQLRSLPFFPVMLIDQCTPAAVARAHRLGVNTILNEHCPSMSARRQLAMMERRSLAVLPMQSSGPRSPRLIGWTFPDEPENNGWTPARLRRTHSYVRGSPDGLLSFVTTGGGFFRAPYRDTRVPLSSYSAFARMADVAGFDLYPLGHCQNDLSSVYEAQRAFVRLAGSMPTFQWIETGPIRPGYCGGFAMSPTELTAEVMLAVVGGARGIGFFTHTWSPAHNAFDVPVALQKTIRSLAGVLAATRAGLLGRTMSSGADNTAIKVLARRGHGLTYVFAVNTLRNSVTAKVQVPGLDPGPLRVIGERRNVAVRGQRFVDSFGPLAVHVYVQQAAR